MKKVLLLGAFVMAVGVFSASAQRLKVRLNFPSGISVRADNHHRPYRDAVWVGPEWTWRNGNYVAVPGHWEKPSRHHTMWVSGRWERDRRGYYWVPGHWR